MSYLKFALERPQEFARMVQANGLKAESSTTSPSAYLIEKACLKLIKQALPQMMRQGIKQNFHWFESKLNNINNIDRLEKIHDMLLNSAYDGAIKMIKKTSKNHEGNI